MNFFFSCNRSWFQDKHSYYSRCRGPWRLCGWDVGTHRNFLSCVLQVSWNVKFRLYAALIAGVPIKHHTNRCCCQLPWITTPNNRQQPFNGTKSHNRTITALDGTQHACYPHVINVGPTMLYVVHRQRWEDLNASLVYSYFDLSVPPM